MTSLSKQQVKDFFQGIVCVAMRYNNFRHEAGLIRIGNPGPDSPVFVSGDYFHTVKKLIKVLKGQDCFLLVVDSAGINVWCAAGVGDFNEHKIADAVNACGLKSVVNHRKLILPQLAAVGIDKKKLFRECGFHGVWGPANLYDIPAYIKNDLKATREMREVRFAFQDRLSQAVGVFFVFMLPVSFVAPFLLKRFPRHILAFTANLVIQVLLTVLYPLVPFIKYPSNKALFYGAAHILGNTAFARLTGPAARKMLLFNNLSTGILSLFIAMDMVGSTPFFKTTIVQWLKTGNNDSLFQPQLNDSCVNCGVCEQVCPKGVITCTDKSTSIDLEHDCCECLACIKQCPVNAIWNINNEYKEDIKSIPDLDSLMAKRSAS